MRDPAKAPGTSDPIDFPAQPIKASSTPLTNTTDVTVKPVSNQGSVTSSGSALFADSETDETTNVGEDLGHAVRSAPRCESEEERSHQNPPSPSSRRASAAAEEIAAALARGAIPHSQDVAPESFQEEHEGRPPEANHSKNGAEPSVLDRDVRASQQSVEFATGSTVPGADGAASVNATTELAAGVEVNHKDARQPDVILRIEDASPDFEGIGDVTEGKGSSNDHDNNGGVFDGGNPRRTSAAPNGEPSARGDIDEDEDSRLQQAPAAVAAAVVGGEELLASQKPPSEAKPRILEEKRRSCVENAESTNEGIVRNGAGSRRRSSDRRDMKDDKGVCGAGWDEVGREGDPHGVRFESGRDVVERDRRQSSSVNQDILQSPPTLSRRTSGRGSGSLLMGFNSAVRSWGSRALHHFVLV